MDHDRLFKELISNFFVEFVELFLPDVNEYLDPEHAITPMDKELFIDVTAGERHEADLVMKAQFRSGTGCFLIHVESQAQPQENFPERMFRYFASLTLKYKLRVYPVVVFSYGGRTQNEPTYYSVDFPDFNVLRFNYRTIQLGKLPWRKFINHANPVAIALMAKMKMSSRERPIVKAECIRLLANLRLDPARATLIGGFIESYLKLTATELKQFEREIAHLESPEKEKAMAILTYWEQKGLDLGIARGIERGIEQGLEQGLEQGKSAGKEETLLRLIHRRFGDISARTTQMIADLSSEQLDALTDSFLDFSSVADLETWLFRSLQA